MTLSAQNTQNKETKLTPMLVQHQSIKEKNPDCLLFFRMGDFYELFFDDAVCAAKALDITLTRRGKKAGEDIPMCGVPFHAAETYIARLIKQGFKVAICEQLETPLEAKKRGPKSVVKRDVVRIITPGTLTEETLLEAKAHNFLSACVIHRGSAAIAVVDISTGDFLVERVARENITSALARFQPKEILIQERLRQDTDVFGELRSWKNCLTIQPDSRFNYDNTHKRLKELLHVETLESFGDFDPSEIIAAGVILEYVHLTQCGNLPQIKPLKQVLSQAFLQLDSATRHNLELHQTLQGEYPGSLLWAIDGTLTNGGGRLLRQRLAAPLYDQVAIQSRLDQVTWFLEKNRDDLRALLRQVPDLERVLSRITLGRSGPRDLKAIHQALNTVSQLKESLLRHPDASVIADIYTGLHDLPDLTKMLDIALGDTLPLLARDGHFVRAGFNAELDSLCALRDHGRQQIIELQSFYIEETKVPGLKIKHNNMLGYFIEITALHKDKLPLEQFIHRQTLANNMRYTTTTLGELEQKLFSAADQALAIELKIFDGLIQAVLQDLRPLYAMAAALSALDVTVSFAELAARYHYVRPTVDDSLIFDVQNGRHPVVEKILAEEGGADFVANQCVLSQDQRLWLLTGPNMAGKSTFLRQNALIVILAQMGSFVPAERAHIGLVDRIFSRVGASDNLVKGQSTFMVEMVETAIILNQSTERSFVILDEVGRGTATYDGVSLAWATVEYLHDVNKARGIFATHYHELTDLADRLPGVSCHTMSVKEWENDVIFLHKVIPGTADRSYGIHVAALAGVPDTVIERATQVLATFEEGGGKRATPSLNTLPLFQQKKCVIIADSEIKAKLKNIDPDALTPKQALDIIYDLKSLAKK